MSKRAGLGAGLLLLAGGVVNSLAADPPLRAVPFTDVKIADEFWSPRINTCLKVTVAHCFKECEETGRLTNFDKAAGKVDGEFEGYFFNDSDVYKVIEGAAYALAHERDPKLEAYVDGVIARIAAAQQPDGYLNSYFTLHLDQPRWGDVRNKHELYCAGHLVEAAIAYYQATGKSELLDVAKRFVDYIDSVFGPDGRHEPPGHEELELALMKLTHLTGERNYADLAGFFIDQRGRADGHTLYGEYAQDHAPLAEQSTIVGHAVRGMYFLSGVADVIADTPSADYAAALDRIWNDTVNGKMYITGGLGSSASNEGFTEAYDLPNETAYAETCASIAMVFWNHRMNLLHADAKYADVMERGLYNGVLAGISLSGDRFNYTNPLASRGDHHRQAWFKCACCPPNILRFLTSVGGYACAVRGGQTPTVYVNLYMAGDAKIALSDERTIHVQQDTRYPWEGRVRLTVNTESPAKFALALRMPGWCAGASLELNGESLSVPTPSKGYVTIQRTWADGDTVEWDMLMRVERIAADERVEADRGRVALQRGPIVYCLEQADNADGVFNLVLPSDAKLSAEHTPDLLGGVTVIRGKALRAESTSAGWTPELYRRSPMLLPVEMVAIPYYAWDNRTAGEMAVWLPEAASVIPPGPVGWVQPVASTCWGSDTLTALHDRLEPASSSDHSIPRFTWWPKRGDEEWVQYDFDGSHRVTGVDVFWFDDEPRGGGCRTPESWRLSARIDGEWREIAADSPRGVAKDRYNSMTFDPVNADALRIDAQLRPEFSAGILEWKVRTE